MHIKLTSVLVDDQSKAKKFYTDILGFVVKNDISMGEFSWLTVVSPDAPDGAELLLEPNQKEAAQVFQKAMYDEGIPFAAFLVDDIQAEFERLKGQGVAFKSEPMEVGGAKIAVFDDTCGNFVQIYQEG